ncbi:MAG: DUF362 domain-containing protein [Chloroflexota bacterium]
MSNETSARSEVYFTPDMSRLPHLMRACGMEQFAGEYLPVKLHMGEPGNPYIIRPDLVGTVVAGLKDAGARPFLFDTTVAYPGDRSHKKGYEKVAHRHGFTREAVGCEVVIGDEGVRVVESGVALEVATHIYEAGCLVVLSHVKGHIQAGFGGAIKNLGMGGVTRASKKRIHHMSVPVHHEDECTLCGLCADACPADAITVDEAWRIDHAECEGCGKCVLACTQGALKWEVMSLAQGLAIGAHMCVSGKKVICVNSLHNIAEGCDCDPRPGGIVCPDIGYLVGTDAAAVDSASLDLIDGREPDVFMRRNGVDPRHQVSCAVDLGMADSYILRTLD